MSGASSPDAAGRSHRSLRATPVVRAPLSATQGRALEAAWSYIDDADAVGLDVSLTDIPSYTGYERALAEFAVARWAALGIDARYQPMDDQQGNALARIQGTGSGPTLLVLCPSDTHWTGSEEQDGLQWGSPPRRDARLPAVVEGQTVLGLGSDNVKGLCTSVMLAVEAVHRAGLAVQGQLWAALAAGGAPALAAPGEPRRSVSLGAGVRHMLSHGIAADFALYHKPGYQVSWQEVGLNQFRIRLEDRPSYMGADGYRLLQDAMAMVADFDRWAREEYPRRADGLWEPLAALNVVQIGRPDKPNWSPAAGDIFIDVRSAPWATAIDVQHEVDRILRRIVDDHPGMRATWEAVAHMPGGYTDPANWVVQSSIRAVQAVDGTDDEVYVGQPAGQTEMGLLQTLGIPSTSIRGMPWSSGAQAAPELPDDLLAGFSLSGAYGPTMQKAAKVLAYVIIDTIARSRGEVGLPA